MKLSQAVEIVNMLLSHGNVWTLTIQRDKEKQDAFHIEISDVYMDADDIKRLLEFNGLEGGGTKLSVEYMEGKFYVKDSDPLADKRKEDQYRR